MNEVWVVDGIKEFFFRTCVGVDNVTLYVDVMNDNLCKDHDHLYAAYFYAINGFGAS